MDAVSSSTDTSVSSYFQDMIQRRQMQQAQRIAQGVQSGQLSETEAGRLAKQQSRIDKMDQKAMSDGTMTSGEFARIMHSQDKASDRIYGLKHNGTTAGSDQAAAVLASNAQTTGAASSNSSALGNTVAADMNKLFQDIAQFRQDYQAQRIQQGVDSGQLTPEEQQKIQTLEANSSAQITKASADGTISPLEFASIMQAQNAASRHIHRYRHNQQFAQPQASAADPSAATAAQNYQPVSVTV